MEPDSTPSDSRAAILAAAAGLFAESGRSATTIKEIGLRAGVNPALIYYYFADKSALYDAVVSELVGGYPARLTEAAAATESPGDALASVVRMQARVFLEDPRLPRLVLRELADNDGDRASPLVGESARRLLATLVGVISRGQESGAFRTDISPQFAAISCLSQLNWFCVSAPLMRVLFGGTGTPSVDDFAEHVVEFTLAGLEAR